VTNAFTGAVSLANTGAFAIQVTDIGSIDLGTVTTANDLTVIALNAGDITDSGTIVAAGTATFTAAADDVILNSASSNYGTVIFGVTTNNAVVVDVDAVAIAGDVDGTLDVTAGGDITNSGALDVEGVAIFDAGTDDITINTAAGDFTAAVSFLGKDVTVIDANALDLGDSTITGNLIIDTTLGAITDSGDVFVGGTTNLSAGTTTANAVTLDSAGNDFAEL